MQQAPTAVGSPAQNSPLGNTSGHEVSPCCTLMDMPMAQYTVVSTPVTSSAITTGDSPSYTGSSTNVVYMCVWFTVSFRGPRPRKYSRVWLHPLFSTTPRHPWRLSQQAWYAPSNVSNLCVSAWSKYSKQPSCGSPNGHGCGGSGSGVGGASVGGAGVRGGDGVRGSEVGGTLVGGTSVGGAGVGVGGAGVGGIDVGEAVAGRGVVGGDGALVLRCVSGAAVWWCAAGASVAFARTAAGAEV